MGEALTQVISPGGSKIISDFESHSDKGGVTVHLYCQGFACEEVQFPVADWCTPAQFVKFSISCMDEIVFMLTFQCYYPYSPGP